MADFQNFTKNEIKIGKTYRQNGKPVSVYEIIRHPELVQWHVYGDMKRMEALFDLSADIANHINKCDGNDGRPTIHEALEFYNTVLIFGGAVYFTSHIRQGTPNTCFRYLKRHCPVGTPKGEWTKKWMNILLRYAKSGYIPDSSAEKNAAYQYANTAIPASYISNTRTDERKRR